MRYPNSEAYPSIMAEKFHTIITVDLEATGLDYWRNEILTLSISAMDYFTLERKDSIELTFRPQNLNYWEKEAEKIHGISVSQALYFSPKSDSTNRAMNFIGDYCRGVPQILLCHAFDKYRTLNYYDVNMIMAHMEKMGKRTEIQRHLRFFQSTETYFREARRRGYYLRGVDMFSLAEGRTHDEEGENYKLGTLCSYYKIPLEHHKAQSDREGCEALYRVARSLGDYEEETNFDLQEQADGDDPRSREESLSELYNSDRGRKDSNNPKQSDERVHFLQSEEE